MSPGGSPHHSLGSPPPGDAPRPPQPAPHHQGQQSLLQVLELELARVRSEASAARWEARAAELELLLRRARDPSPETTPAPASASAAPASAASQPLDDWQPLVLAVQRRAEADVSARHQSSAARANATAGGVKAGLRRARPSDVQRRPPPQAMPVGQLQRLAVQQPAPPQRRRRPAAWLCSVAAHLLVLVLLAMMTIASQTPKDQIALAASAPSADPPALQMLQIAPADTPAPSQQPAPREVAAVVSPLGDLAAVPEVALDLPQVTGPASAIAAALSQGSGLGDFGPASPQELTTQFFGVQGGGNHFCYVVDSSLSMSGGRFEGARAELLRSIDQLTAEQRFYVMFYSANLDRMQVDQAGQPDLYSVTATPENKLAVRRWAMGVRLQPGGPPDEALRFALQLRPDVIFLLSDGEFPQRIEDLVSELNRSANLFGDSGPRTILHTIAYQSREGEARMRRLADANGGQYRYVPDRKSQ